MVLVCLPLLGSSLLEDTLTMLVHTRATTGLLRITSDLSCATILASLGQSRTFITPLLSYLGSHDSGVEIV